MWMVRLMIGALAVWGLTRVIGWGGRKSGLMRRMSLSGALDCFLCVSLWVASPFGYLMGSSYVEVVLLVLALSAAAMLIDRAAGYSESGPLLLERPHEEQMEVWVRDVDRREPGHHGLKRTA